MFRWIWYLWLLSLLPSTVRAQVHGYELLARWSDLPQAKVAMSVGLVSSTDRTPADKDFNQYLHPEGFQAGNSKTVIAELPGPGVITRFWMPHATANYGYTVRLLVDGAPLIDTRSNLLFAGGYGRFEPPLVQTLIGGQVSYEPIAFQRSLRIESNNIAPAPDGTPRHFYQYNYLRLPPSQPVVPYSETLSPEERTARAVVATMLGAIGSNPAGPSTTAIRKITPGQTIDARQACVLADVHAGGTVRCINLKMPPCVTDTQLDTLRLRVRYEDRPTYAIDVPVAHFFGAGHSRARYRSLPVGTDSPNGYYCYWPMPFRQVLRVELFNAGRLPITFDSARVEYEPGAPPRDAGYFRAVHRQARTKPGQEHHVLLDVRGAGHYVGNLLYVARFAGQPGPMEGDDIIIVNPGKPDETVLHGTGLEDAYNGGYYYNHEQVVDDERDLPNPTSGTGPYHGLLYMEYAEKPFLKVHTAQYRWMVADLVPFIDGILVQMENFGQQAGVVFGSTAFYCDTSAAQVSSTASQPAASGPS